jgi:hypothetical protein
MTHKIHKSLIVLLWLIIFSSMNILDEAYNCPMKNSIVEKYIHGKFTLSDPVSGSKINSYSDSLVYSTMSGIVLKKVVENQNTKSLIIRHNDSIISIYSNLDTIFFDINDNVDIYKPIGIAQKVGNQWQIRFAIWNKILSLNTDSILKCNNN